MSRITELPNTITTDIDKADTINILRLLRVSDFQLISGYSAYLSIMDIQSILSQIATTVANKFNQMEEVMTSYLFFDWKEKKLLFVMSGSGTSGRLSFMVSRMMNNFLKDWEGGKYHHRIVFDYLIAGGDPALILSQEKAEDDVTQSQNDIQELIDQYEDEIGHLVYIGISCGFSAPYVAGQLDWILEQNVP